MSQNNLNNKNCICVSGASGFLGQAIVRHFAALGYHVIALTRSPLKNSHEFETFNVVNVHGSIREWVSAIEKYQPFVFFSCDWEGVVNEVRNNEQIQKGNIDRILYLARHVRDSRTSIFIGFGSQAELAPSDEMISELSIDNPQSEYGRAKVFLRKSLSKIFGNSSTNFIWVRVFSVYGPGDTRSWLIPDLIRKFRANEEFRLKAPEAKISPLFIIDFLKAIEKILSSQIDFGVINVGNRIPVTTRTISTLISKILDCPNIASEQSTKKNLVHVPNWLPLTTTLDKMGWDPEVSLERGLEETILWWSKTSNA